MKENILNCLTKAKKTENWPFITCMFKIRIGDKGFRTIG